MSEEKYIACIDVGTTGCRTILFSVQGALTSEAYQEYSSIFLSPTWIDHDPGTWIQAARDTLRQAVGQNSGGPERHRRHLRDLAAIHVHSRRCLRHPS